MKFTGIKEAFAKLSVRQRQLFWVCIIISVLGAVTMTISSSMDKTKKKAIAEKAYNPKKMTLMTDKVEKEMWVAAEGQNIKALEKSNEEMRSQLDKFKKDLEEQKETLKKPVVVKGGAPATPPPGPKRGGREAVLAVPAVPGAPAVPSKTACSGDGCANPQDPQGGAAQYATGQQGQQAASRSSSGGPSGKPPHPGSLGAQGRPTDQGPPGSAIRMFKSGDKKPDTKKDKKDEEPTTFLPAGSFMRAILLSGIDAPTAGGKSTSEPYPVLLGVTDLSILPNQYRMNLKECFIIGAGQGNISDERAYIRTETLSCIRSDNKVIEVALKGQVMGEDGKLGIRGRLVSKQGQQIAMAIFAGTLGGLSAALTPTSVPQFNFNSGNNTGTTGTSYQQPSMGQVGQIAAMSGAGKSLEMVAQYYLKMAERIFPIIEIDAGRVVEVVLLKGQELKLAGGSRPKRVSSSSSTTRKK